jgi:hypothetical protein
MESKKQSRNLFQFAKHKHTKITFKVTKVINDMHDYPYIMKFMDSNDNEFAYMVTDFQTQIKNGIIIIPSVLSEK